MDATVTCTEHYFFISISRYHITTALFGVEYYHNKAWMITAVFQTWLTNCDHDLGWVQGNCKVLLIVSNASSHVWDDLSNIKIQYLLPNRTSKLQAMDQGVCRSIKCCYRTRLKEGTWQLLKRVKLIARGIDLKVAMDMLTASWNSIPPSLIKNCFCHAGLSRTLLSNQHKSQVLGMWCTDQFHTCTVLYCMFFFSTGPDPNVVDEKQLHLQYSLISIFRGNRNIWDNIWDVLGVPSSFEEFALADNKEETSEQVSNGDTVANVLSELGPEPEDDDEESDAIALAPAVSYFTLWATKRYSCNEINSQLRSYSN